MFREISSGVFESSDGYVVNDHGHWEILYIEDDHVASIFCEPGGPGYIYLLSRPIIWKPPHHNEEISEERQAQIRARLRAVLDFRGFPYLAE